DLGHEVEAGRLSDVADEGAHVGLGVAGLVVLVLLIVDQAGGRAATLGLAAVHENRDPCRARRDAEAARPARFEDDVAQRARRHPGGLAGAGPGLGHVPPGERAILHFRLFSRTTAVSPSRPRMMLSVTPCWRIEHTFEASQ